MAAAPQGARSHTLNHPSTFLFFACAISIMLTLWSLLGLLLLAASASARSAPTDGASGGQGKPAGCSRWSMHAGRPDCCPAQGCRRRLLPPPALLTVDDDAAAARPTVPI